MERDCKDLPFKEQLQCVPSLELYRIMKDCADYDEEEVIMTIAELGQRFEQRGIRASERRALTLFACSTDVKQYTLGVDMLTGFLPREECEKYMVAIYLLAGRAEGQEKSMPRMKAGYYLMRGNPDQELSEIIEDLTNKHSDFIENIRQIRDESLILLKK